MKNFEQPQPSAEQYLLDIEGVSYKEFLQCQKKELDILQNIHQTLSKIANRQDAEAYFLEELAPRLQEAKQESAQAFQVLIDVVSDTKKESEKREELEKEPPITHFG